MKYVSLVLGLAICITGIGLMERGNVPDSIAGNLKGASCGGYYATSDADRCTSDCPCSNSDTGLMSTSGTGLKKMKTEKCAGDSSSCTKTMDTYGDDCPA